MNSRATSVTAWGLYRSAISACLVYLREIGRTAFWRFCNTICQEETSLIVLSAAGLSIVLVGVVPTARRLHLVVRIQVPFLPSDNAHGILCSPMVPVKVQR